jgi:hypothetical protein
MAKFNLSEAASAILEGSKETFDSNIAAKRGQRGQTGTKPEVGTSKLDASVAYGTSEAGDIGNEPKLTDDGLPDYTKGVPSATPPGATPPVGAEAGSKLSGQPQQTMGRADLVTPTQASATDYSAIRDRIAGKLAPQMMQANPGATFQAYAEDINAMLSGENLSEEFVSKATTIFEAAVVARATEVVEIMEQELTEQFEVAVEQVKEDLASKVDDYLNYMVEEWMKENEIAIEKGLRAEIAEDFINGLRDLFVEHYIDIPTEKVDIVSELAEKVEELEESLNAEINRGVELTKELNEQRKIEAIYTACEGLTQTQVEKMKSLAEGMEFTTESEFADKMETLKESYFQSTVKTASSLVLDEEVFIEEEKKVYKSSDPAMDIYAKTISKNLIK